MLLIRAWLLKPVDDNNARYQVAVFVNASQIWEGVVDGHKRSQGWPALAAHIARKAGIEEPAKKNLLEAQLKLVYDCALRDNQVKCPACNKHLSRTDSPACPKCGSQKLRCDNGCTWTVDKEQRRSRVRPR